MKCFSCIFLFDKLLQILLMNFQILTYRTPKVNLTGLWRSILLMCCGVPFTNILFGISASIFITEAGIRGAFGGKFVLSLLSLDINVKSHFINFITMTAIFLYVWKPLNTTGMISWSIWWNSPEKSAGSDIFWRVALFPQGYFFWLVYGNFSI